MFLPLAVLVASVTKQPATLVIFPLCNSYRYLLEGLRRFFQKKILCSANFDRRHPLFTAIFERINFVQKVREKIETRRLAATRIYSELQIIKSCFLEV